MITPIFTVGQEIVCVNASFVILLAQDPRINVPVKDQVYTVRRNLQFTHDVGLLLEGLDNSHALPKKGKIEPNFSQSRFIAMLPQDALVLQEKDALLEAA